MNLNSINFILIIISVGLTLLAWNNEKILMNWTMNPYMIRHRKQYYRFLTSGFIHADFTHLLFNMFTLFFFGMYLEQTFENIFGSSGKVLYFVFYILGILVADIPTYIKHKNNHHYNSLGASGAVSAVVFGMILFYPTEKIYIFGLIGIPGILYAILFVWYSYAMEKRGRDFINHSAHLYGALFGWLFVSILYPYVWIHFINEIINYLPF
ncbi:MAG: hypothetical protein RIR51_671 [Bacteroidota bacterium]|jgi:membrane associated rhomboid family serine protease